MSVVIPRNTTIPVKKSTTFYTIKDNQSSVFKEIYEGERTTAIDNNLLGEFTVSGIPRAPKGHPILTCFELDVDGILCVTAEEKTTGNKNQIIIANDKGKLSQEEIERLIEEAERYKVEDEKFLKKAKAIRALDDYVYDMEKALIGSKLCPEDTKKLNLQLIRLEQCLMM
ncbi:hypothetical protein PIB30_064731, partial [Stylosanthes scabra]|nr:hypothetical protein [Stylosanthes scabra]